LKGTESTERAGMMCEISYRSSQYQELETQRMLRPIVFACDETYALPLATALRSAVDANRGSEPLDVYILCDQFSANTRKKVIDSVPEGSAVIRWVQVDLSSFEKFPTLPHISSKMTFARFMIPHVFTTDVHRVLYLDADLLVLDDLGPLWEMDLKGAVLGAVLDRILDPQLKACAPGLEKFPRVRDYFNAGVLLIDLDRWRMERISETALEYLIRCPDSPLADQDALNVACDGRWTELGLHWNFYDHFQTPILRIPPSDRPKIAHFTGQKPWKASALSVNADLYELFRRRTRFSRSYADKFQDLAIEAWFRLKRYVVGTSLGQAIRSRYKSRQTDSAG
jgi:lipopolysaccharide biosynthesis glycosyltransferase